MAAAFLIAVSTNAQKITLGTFNIRYDNARDTGNLWVDRASAFYHMADSFERTPGVQTPMGNLHQIYIWKEPINGSGCCTCIINNNEQHILTFLINLSFVNVDPSFNAMMKF